VPPVSRRDRAIAAFVQAAPLLGVAVWVLLLVTHPGDYAYMFVFFMPGLVMLPTALAVALVAVIVAPRGFVRTHAAGSLRFHGIVGAVSTVLLVLGFAALAKGVFSAAQSMVMLFGVLLPIVEIGRSLMYGLRAVRGE
jgi:hypothetical protein